MATPLASEPALLVLLTLRLRSFASAAVVADASGVPVGEVSRLLGEFAAADLVKYREGKLTGWLLTGAGRAEGQRLLADELAAAPDHVGVTVRSCYQDFLARNQEMLELCTAWQLKGGASSQVINDHTDADYDRGVLADLRRLDTDILPVVEGLAGVLARFGSYGRRFGHALTMVEGGDPDFFTKPLIDSYHTVWFELHEHLLASLGIERSSEAAP